MAKTAKILILLAAIFLGVVNVSAITTGDLLMSMKTADDWPPVTLERPPLPFVFGSDNFLIHYATEGENAVFEADVDINPADGTPDYVNRMSEFLETTRFTYLTELGYDMPPPDEGNGGDDSYDIYVTTITGLTVPEFRSEFYPDRVAYAAYSYIGNDLRNVHHPEDPIPLLKATCAHEYFHAVQMAYRAIVADDKPWWFELTANWAEERVFDDLNEVYYYLNDYYDKIDKSIYKTGGTHMYGAWVFAEYLSQNYGDDIIEMIFGKLINFDYTFDAILTLFNELELDFDEEFTRFAGWNYFTGENYRPGFFDEGADFPISVPISSIQYSYPTGWINTPKAMENLGIAYIYFGNYGIAKCDLVIEFAAGDNYPEGFCIGALYNDRPAEIVTLVLQPGESGAYRVDDFSDCDGVVLSVNWSYEYSAIDDDSADYSYNAYIDSTVDIADNRETVPAAFQLLDNYPNPFNQSSIIIFYWNLAPLHYNINIYDLTGRIVDRLDGLARTGQNSVLWSPGTDIASGLYLYRLEIGGAAATKRMIFLK